jgi:PAS domain S-box-containing protein
MREFRGWFENIMTSIAEAVLVTDALGFIRYVNTAAESMTGWDAKELIGRQFEKGIPILAVSHEQKTPLNFRMALKTRWQGTATIGTYDRKKLCVELCASPVVDNLNGYAVGVVTVLKPIAGGCTDHRPADLPELPTDLSKHSPIMEKPCGCGTSVSKS